MGLKLGAVRQRRHLCFVVAALLATPALARSSPFDGIPGVKFRYYDVEGSTPAEIYKSMRARAPQKGGGVAHTAWHIRAGWGQVRRGSSCQVSDPQSSLSILVVMPRLVTRELTPMAAEYWRRTLRGLEIHEAGHARIAYDHRNDFIRAARDATCGTIKRIAEQTQARIEKIQADYDRDTRHGLTQIPVAEESAVAIGAVRWAHHIME